LKDFHPYQTKLNTWPPKVAAQLSYGHYITDIFTGLFPDAAVILKVTEKDVISRILPSKMAIWTRKRDKRLAIREAKKQKRIKEWVSNYHSGLVTMTRAGPF